MIAKKHLSMILMITIILSLLTIPVYGEEQIQNRLCQEFCVNFSS